MCIISAGKRIRSIALEILLTFSSSTGSDDADINNNEIPFENPVQGSRQLNKNRIVDPAAALQRRCYSSVSK
ncbi:hypothetical protein MFRU_057g00110 [Monilinia fructicola]|nr:hypothetical protein MFRU_057g00110 [Monilinia fructicola]